MGLEAEGERIAASAVARMLDRLEPVLTEALPGDVTVEQEAGELRLSGRRLAARAISDPRLRAIGLLAKEELR